MNSFHLLQTLKLFTALHGNLIIIAGPVISPLMLLAISLVLKPKESLCREKSKPLQSGQLVECDNVFYTFCFISIRKKGKIDRKYLNVLND